MTDKELSTRVQMISDVLAGGVSKELADEMYEELMELKSEVLRRMEEPEAEKEGGINPDLITERKEQYGNFGIFVKHMTTIMDILKSHRVDFEGEPEHEITKEDTENFFIVLKLLRMQTASDNDSLVDLENYARLIKERRENNS